MIRATKLNVIITTFDSECLTDYIDNTEMVYNFKDLLDLFEICLENNDFDGASKILACQKFMVNNSINSINLEVI